jgi:thioredoxin-related protein
MKAPFDGPRPTQHEYEAHVPDRSGEPITTHDYPNDGLAIRREDLPTVHTVHAVPHIHLQDEAGEDYAVHCMPGDSPRDLVLMGMHYIALGLAMREQLNMGWDEKWTGPHPEGQPGWQEGHHHHD